MDGDDVAGAREFEIRGLRDLAVLGGIVGAFNVTCGGRDDECAVRQAVIAVGQQVHLGDRPAHLDRLRVPDEFRRQFGRADKIKQCVARIGARDHNGSADLLTARELHPGDFEIIGEDRLHVGIGTHFPAARFERADERVGDAPYPAFDALVPRAAAVQPIVHQCVAAAGGHRAER